MNVVNNQNQDLWEVKDLQPGDACTYAGQLCVKVDPTVGNVDVTLPCALFSLETGVILVLAEDTQIRRNPTAKAVAFN